MAPGIYVTINPVNPDLLARAINQLKPKMTATTSDADVVRRQRLLIDCDPVRPSGVSSTDAELALAATRAREVRAYLACLGWPEPLESMSGNGHHLTYEIDLPANDEGLVERVLKSLAARFDDEKVKIDTGVGNAARICKIVGTMARKGDDCRGVAGVEDRPHRRSAFTSIPDHPTTVSREQLELETTLAPTPPNASVDSPTTSDAPTDRRARRRRFATFPHTAAGVRDYLRQHGIEVAGERPKDDCTILDLVECPVTGVPAEGTEISVLVGRDGSIAFRNMHNRGTGITWHHVREKLEPGYLAHVARSKNNGTATSPPPQGEADEDDGSDSEVDESESESDTQRDRLIRLAGARYRFGRSQSDEPFAVPLCGPNIARMLHGSKSLRSELASAYYRHYRKAAGSSALADAMLVLEGAALATPAEAVHLRLARSGESIVLDLGDHSGRAVVIDAKGWQVVEVSPVLFKRNALTAPLPTPLSGGSLDQLRHLLNVSESAWPLTLAWIVAAFIPDIEHPIMLVGGQQDAGKSTTAKFIACLIDPSTAVLRTAPGNLQDWAVAASGSWVVPIDNISTIPDWLSDACCRAVTGDGMVRRALYTDGDLAVLMFQRCLILTSIDTGALKGDLGRRLIQLTLQPLTGDKKKRPPKRLKDRYDRERPAILGALLDLLVKVLAVLPTIKLEEFFALADFEEVLAALDKVLGTKSLDLYKAQWERIAADVVEGDPVAEAVRVFATEQCLLGPWIGRASDLLQEVTTAKPPPKWPRSPTGFAGALRRAIPALKALGVEVIPPDETDKTRRYVVRLTAQNAQPPETGPVGVEKGGFGSGVGPGGCMGGFDGDRPERASGGGVVDENADRPDDRPPENRPSEAGNAGSGRSGGSGGCLPPLSPSADDDSGEEGLWTG